MKTTKINNLKNEYGLFLESIDWKTIQFTSNRDGAINLNLFKIFIYRMFIRFRFKSIVTRSSLVYCAGEIK